MKVVLHLTKNCNLRCKYCYAPTKTPASMSPAIARQSIDFIIEQSGSSACVSYFGGEPLLNFGLIQELTEYATQKGNQHHTEIHFRLSTNGTLFTEEILKFCRDHNMLFALSLDGDKEAHNSMRVFPDGSGSFDQIDHKLDMVLKYNPYTVITSVITPATVKRLSSSVQYLWKRGIRYMVYAPDFTHPNWTPEIFEDLEQSYQELAAFYVEQIRQGQHFHMSLFDDKLKSHARSLIELGTLCDFGAKKISVASDGRIYPCVQFVSNRPDAADYCIGTVDQGFSKKRDLLIQENKQEREQCQDCTFLGRCANYCGCTNWQVTGKLTEVPGILCAHEKMLIPIADQIGNTLWDERNARFLKKHYRDYAEIFQYSID